MSKYDLDEILNEIKNLQMQKDQENILKELNEKDKLLVNQAIKAVEYMDTLNEKQKQYYKYLQKKQPLTANAIVKLQNGESLNDIEIESVLKEANDISTVLISSKQIRLSLSQEAILNYLAHKEHETIASFIRNTLIEKMNDYFKNNHIKKGE